MKKKKEKKRQSYVKIMNYTTIVITKMNVVLHTDLKNLEKILFFQVIKRNYVKVFKTTKFVILVSDALIGIL